MFETIPVDFMVFLLNQETWMLDKWDDIDNAHRKENM